MQLAKNFLGGATIFEKPLFRLKEGFYFARDSCY